MIRVPAEAEENTKNAVEKNRRDVPDMRQKTGKGAMMLFGKKKTKKTYDKGNQRPVLKCSICNGEQVAGFKDIHTGKFEEIMLIRNQADLNTFLEMYDLEEIEKEY